MARKEHGQTSRQSQRGERQGVSHTATKRHTSRLSKTLDNSVERPSPKPRKGKERSSAVGNVMGGGTRSCAQQRQGRPERTQGSPRPKGDSRSGTCRKSDDKMPESTLFTSARAPYIIAHGDTAEKGSPAVRTLRAEVKSDAQGYIKQAETECDAMVAEALASSSEGTVGKDADDEEAGIWLREMENHQESIASDCLEMLKALENHHSTLLGLGKHFSAALDNAKQAENRKLKGSIARRLGSMS